MTFRVPVKSLCYNVWYDRKTEDIADLVSRFCTIVTAMSAKFIKSRK